MNAPLIRSARLKMYRLDEVGAARVRDYYLHNREHLDPWEPVRSPDFHTLAAWQNRIELAREDHKAGRAVKLVMTRNDASEIVGVCNFTNIVRGPFMACNLGYSVAASAQGQGLMYEALEAAIQYMFREEKLHRIMANYMPENSRSARLLNRLGFAVEGHAKQYLHINGAWRDHVLTAKVNPDG